MSWSRGSLKSDSKRVGGADTGWLMGKEYHLSNCILKGGLWGEKKKKKMRANIKTFQQKRLTFIDVNCYELYQFIPAEDLSLNLFFLLTSLLDEFTGEWDKSKRKLSADIANSKVHLSGQPFIQNNCDLILLCLRKKTEIKSKLHCAALNGVYGGGRHPSTLSPYSKTRTIEKG